VLPDEFYSGHRERPNPLEQYLPETSELEFEGVRQFALDPAKVEASDFALAQHRVMYQFWLGNRVGDELPPSSAIDPLAFSEALGFVHLVQPNDDYSDFRYRVYASAAAEIGKVDLTGKWFSESTVPSWSFYRRQLAAAAALRAPVYSENNADYSVSLTVKWCRLLLPMADPAGRVDRIVVAIVPVRRSLDD
jgi:hypothetical protein